MTSAKTTGLCLVLVVRLASCAWAGTVNDAYPGLASAALTHAALADLAPGTLFKAGELSLAEKDLAAQIEKTPKELQDQLRKNAFFVLDNMATERLVLQAARAGAARNNTDASRTSDADLIRAYLTTLVDKVQIADKEVADFYNRNKDMFGEAKLEQVKAQLGDYLLQEKRQDVINKHIVAFGERTKIEVAASWVKEQAVSARDNPVDKARMSGRPSFVDFGADGCRPCDLMAPILTTLRKKYEGKVNVEFVHVREQQILAARYGIQSIPVQVFFDKDGKELFRHVGFFPQDEIEKKLAEMGVK